MKNIIQLLVKEAENLRRKGPGPTSVLEDMEAEEDRHNTPDWLERPRKQRNRELLRDSKKEVSCETGEPYSCPDSELPTYKALARKLSQNYRAFDVSVGAISNSMDTAGNRIRAHLHDNFDEWCQVPPVQQAILRLQSAVGRPEPDLIIKAFNDVDLVFFGGVLRAHTLLEWHPYDTYAPREEMRRIHGVTYSRAIPRNLYTVELLVIIDLFSKPVYHEDWNNELKISVGQCLWTTLLHEMVHAYFCRTAHKASSEEARAPGPDPGHGIHFWNTFWSVRARAQYLFGKKLPCRLECAPGKSSENDW